ncbi:MAG: hypothetical protein MJZ64_05930 [Paludibacteraceae bacterium]|nr:hypothetical protein [Paludibacteraceae bacterium]
MTTLTISFMTKENPVRTVSFVSKYEFTNLAKGKSNEEFIQNGEAHFIAEAIWGAITTQYPSLQVDKSSVRCIYKADNGVEIELSDQVINA